MVKNPMKIVANTLTKIMARTYPKTAASLIKVNNLFRHLKSPILNKLKKSRGKVQPDRKVCNKCSSSRKISIKGQVQEVIARLIRSIAMSASKCFKERKA